MRKLPIVLVIVGVSTSLFVFAQPAIWNADGAIRGTAAGSTVHLPFMSNCADQGYLCPGDATASPQETEEPIPSETTHPPTTPTQQPSPTPDGVVSIARKNTGFLGFSDVGPRQVVRTSDNRLYALFPEIYKPYIRAIRSTTTGTPSAFAEVDMADRPTAASSVWAVDTAIDGKDVIHVLYISEDGPLRYVTLDTTTDQWGKPSEVTSSVWPQRNSGLRQGSVGVSLVLDANGVAHVAYGRTQSGLRRLYYNNNNGGNWNHEALIDDQPGADNSHAVLAFGGDNALHVAWLADGGGKASLRARVLRGTTWSGVAVIDDNVFRDNQYSIDQGPSMLVTPDGHVHITYIGPYEPVAGSPRNYDYGRVHHHVSTDGGATWVADDPPLRYSHDPSLATDAAGNLYLFGHREYWKASSCADMLVAVQPSGGDWAAWRTFAAGCYDSGVSAKWAQYHWNAPNVLDILYWTEKGPQGESDYNQLFYAEVRGGVAAINSLPQAPAP